MNEAQRNTVVIGISPQGLQALSGHRLEIAGQGKINVYTTAVEGIREVLLGTLVTDEHQKTHFQATEGVEGVELLELYDPNVDAPEERKVTSIGVSLKPNEQGDKASLVEFNVGVTEVLKQELPDMPTTNPDDRVDDSQTERQVFAISAGGEVVGRLLRFVHGSYGLQENFEPAYGVAVVTIYPPEEAAEREILKGLIEVYGAPHTVVHDQYEIGSDHTEGVLTEGCCAACVDNAERGHSICTPLTEELKVAEAAGIVYRANRGGSWWVVVDSKFNDLFDRSANTSGWGEED